jgi:hypothetical protein
MSTMLAKKENISRYTKKNPFCQKHSFSAFLHSTLKLFEAKQNTKKCFYHVHDPEKERLISLSSKSFATVFILFYQRTQRNEFPGVDQIRKRKKNSLNYIICKLRTLPIAQRASQRKERSRSNKNENEK